MKISTLPGASIGRRAGVGLAVGAIAAASAAAAPPAWEPLDPEKAFPVSARVRPGGVDLVFRIVDGYYLYANRFRIEADPALAAGAPRLPPGEVKDDPFVGRTEIVRRSATLHVPFTRPAPAGTYEIKVTAQGCAEDRVCYAPFTQAVRIQLPASR